MAEKFEHVLDRVSTYSRPSDLRITDIRFADLQGAPLHSILVKIYTNQGIVGVGELRDNGSRLFGEMLKGRLLGENPCNVDRLFQRIRQFGVPCRQAGGVSGIEMALWDLAGKAYGVPVYAMLGGKFRDQVRVYCDLGYDKPTGKSAEDFHQAIKKVKNDGTTQGKRLKKYIDEGGFTMVKCVLGVEQLAAMFPDEPILSGPTGFLDELKHAEKTFYDFIMVDGSKASSADFRIRNRAYDILNIQGPYTMTRITEHGLDRYEEQIANIRKEIGPEVSLAIDHMGHISLEESARLLKRLEKYNLSWAEDILPCTHVEEYKRLSQMTTTTLAAGEDLVYTEGFEPLCRERAVAVIHPDICSSGGILETKRIGEMAQKYNVAMACHMCETPVAALATAHMGVATDNFIAMEFNAPGDPTWGDMVTGLERPVIENGFVTPSEKPGLGFDDTNDEVLETYLMPGTTLWEDTERWNGEYSNDRLWS